MRILQLDLSNFRNYTRLELDLSDRATLIQGDNAQGKTNLLEAIYYLSTVRSPQARADRELINWLAAEQEAPFARLAARLQRGDSVHRLEITLLQRGGNEIRPSLRKEIRINGVSKRVADFVGQLNVVLFRPEDIELIAGPPSLRRRYLDVTLCQVDSRYLRALQQYNRIVTRRNALLRDLAERGGDPEQLLFWDEGLVENGAYLLARRQQAVAELNQLSHDTHLDLTAHRERLRLRYQPSFDFTHVPDADYQMLLGLEWGLGRGTDQLTAQAQKIARAFGAQLRELRRREIQAGMSLIGPHRDDLRFLVDGRDMATYGSRGQMRTIVLALKMAEVRLLRQETGEQPVLLLDDVMSELDAVRRRCLLELIDSEQQAILTTTDLSVYSEDFIERATLLRVEEGRISEISRS